MCVLPSASGNPRHLAMCQIDLPKFKKHLSSSMNGSFTDWPGRCLIQDELNSSPGKNNSKDLISIAWNWSLGMWFTGSNLHLITKFRSLQSRAELHSIYPITAHDLAKILPQKHLLKFLASFISTFSTTLKQSLHTSTIRSSLSSVTLASNSESFYSHWIVKVPFL